MRFLKSQGLAAVLCAVVTLAAPGLFGEEPPLINIQDLAPGIRIEMRYATTDNFTKEKLYPIAECLLCEPAARRLANVQKSLEKKGLGLKVWDCYRPLSIQKKLWDIVPDPRYVADPKTGSRHNRGASVDLTLVDSRGVELPMPTAFDEFSEKAHRDFDDLPKNIKINRALLQTEMEKEGFIGLPTEWWHFDSPEWNAYALRDEPLGSASLKHDLPTTVSLPNTAQQLVMVVSSTWNATTASLYRFERSENSANWKPVGKAWPVNLGAKGLSWHHQKKEGDLTGPAGVFKIGQAYGYAESAPTGSKWKYQPVSEGWICVDDPASSAYNRVFRPDSKTKKDWSSAEVMRRSDHIYKWIINIEHNPDRVKGCGSCIFMHVWRRPGSPTEGCTAMEESNMVELLRWLDPARSPHLVQLPDEIYTPLKKSGALP